MMRFWVSFAATAVGTLCTLGLAGLAVSRALVAPPPDTLRTPAFEMQLADGWQCMATATEFECQPSGQDRRVAIAVISTKVRGPNDKLTFYRTYLSTPKTPAHSTRDAESSRVVFVRDRRLAGYDWIEALHAGSLIGGYDSYYLATVTSHLAFVVTLTAKETEFARLQGALLQMIDSLVVYQSPTS